MSEDSADSGNQEDSESQRANSEALSETIEKSETIDSGTLEREGEVTDPNSVSEDDYIMAPTDNDPDRGDGNKSNNTDSEN